MIPRCVHDQLPITNRTLSAKRSPTGWSHARWGGWEGIRCPGRLTGAEPAESYPPNIERTITWNEIIAYHEAHEVDTS